MMRVLIAEDERITRLSLARQLEALGHAVASAEDGEAAWEQFKSDAFDMVITDWEMPSVSGVELIRRIRRTSTGAYVYVIMLTSRSNKSDLVEGIEAGADDFISKPFDREELRVRMLAGERIIRLERTLSDQNIRLQQAHDRIQRDLNAAARVQQAMLPRGNILTGRARTAWAYVPTDELAGDAIGLHLIDDRYLVAYVIDVSGHGVPAALLSVTAMHYMEPNPPASSLLRDLTERGGLGTVRLPSQVATELNQHFRPDSSDARYLTMILCVLDTHDGRLCVSSAGHMLPLIVRADRLVTLDDVGGLPIGLLAEGQYEDSFVQLASGDRVYLYSDGIVEQFGATGAELFGLERLEGLLRCDRSRSIDQVVTGAVDSLAGWAGGRRFADDVTLVALEWQGASGA
jgi:sigma-B regulation protein RsbU (phosphoserine phosphatase)